jgi:hypothetical protein
MMASIAEKRDRLCLLHGHHDSMASLGTYQAIVDAALAELKANKVIQRIWAHDYTVWKPQPTEITNRLGWLHSPEVMVEHLPRINEMVDAVNFSTTWYSTKWGPNGPGHTLSPLPTWAAH